ncbi:MAG TPA: hypothetical protein EYP80_02420 [Candidatus Aenigmarchaeota archaeon]|nr:hypothetical protein [Candidatus Aenigmarchaeota archaeon]
MSEERKEVLRDLYVQLNPVALKKRITELQVKLMRVKEVHWNEKLKDGHPVDSVYNLKKVRM